MNATVESVLMRYRYLRDGLGRKRGPSHREIDVSVEVQGYEIDLEFIESNGTVRREPHESEELMKDEYLDAAIDAAEGELEDLGFELNGE